MMILVDFMCIILVLAILPFVPDDKIRYYACYIFYFVYSNLLALISTPLGVPYYRDPRSIGLSSKLVNLLSYPLGITWDIRNKDKLKKGLPAIIVANHQSIFDILGMHTLQPYQGTFTAVAAKKLLYFFPWGPSAWLGGLIFVERNSKSSQSREDATRQAQKLLNKGVKVWFYAEGTRNSTNENFLPFKKGAFHMAIDCQTPIIPVVFSRYTFIDHKNKTFKKGKIIVSVLDEIPTKGLTKKDVDSIVSLTQQRMSDAYRRIMNEIETSWPQNKMKSSERS